MDPAFFVSRSEILNWFNEFFCENYAKIEQFASGAGHCQIMHVLFPDAINLGRVNFFAKFEHEHEKNWKLLQECFSRLGINKHVPIDRLIKAKYMDNLEFAQWMKRYFDVHYDGTPYDSKYERERGLKKFNSKRPALASIEAGQHPQVAPAPEPVKKVTKSISSEKSAVKSTSAEKNSLSVADKKQNSTGPSRAALSKIESLETKISDMQTIIDGLERERDFYFGKLRDIEILCQSKEEDRIPVLEEIFKILYATDEDFIIPGEDEQAAPVE